MNERRASAILGFQVAFLIFAAALLAAAVEKFLPGQWPWLRDLEVPTGRAALLTIPAMLLVAIAPLRRHCASLLATPLRPGGYREIGLAFALKGVAGTGAFGALALGYWLAGGEAALARAMGEQTRPDLMLQSALSPAGLVYALLAVLVAPIVEEVVFRGMLYPAWAKAWGWVFGAVASALVFGVFHGAVVPQFFSGIIFVCLMRRTGSLRACIYMHALANLLLWYPLLGRFMFPSGRSTGELHLWWPHLTCLALTAVLLPFYMWKSRDARVR